MRIFLASPYTSTKPAVRKERYEWAIDASVYLLSRFPKAIIYSPIVHWHAIAERHQLPYDHAFWTRNSDEFVAWATKIYVLMLPGWKQSRGVQQEINRAHYWLKVVQRLDPRVVLKWLQERS